EVTAVPWSDVEGPLARILRRQIQGLLEETKDEDCFVGRYIGQPVEIAAVCQPDVPAEQHRLPLVDVLHGLVQAPAPGAVEHTEAIRLAAGKYLAQNRSQGAVLCLITFEAPLAGGRRRFAFLTQVDLEDVRPEALIGADGRLKVEELKNVFERKSLSKGALYPALPDPGAAAFRRDEIYVHNERSVDYWKLTLECARQQLPASGERRRIVAVLKRSVSRPGIVPQIIQNLAQQARLHPTMGPDEAFRVASAVDSRLSRELFRETWRSEYGSESYTANVQSAVGPNTKAFEVTAGDLKIVKIPPALLDQLVQVVHAGQRFLVVPLEVPARLRADGADCDLPEITLPEFSDRVRNPR
ncbi:MAG TPA: hypothetical protein VNT75_12675, partial [Symbiobacteriaceae bacterium]|nr:hypothetical protein [Symbiobacteriaceae bacterium]